MPSAFWKLAKLYDGRTSAVLAFSEAFVLRGSMYVYIYEPMGHGNMKILEGQDYTQCLPTVLSKKAKSLILLKELCSIYMGTVKKNSL